MVFDGFDGFFVVVFFRQRRNPTIITGRVNNKQEKLLSLMEASEPFCHDGK